MKTKPTLRGTEIFWDNGKFVAVITDGSNRTNVARYNCRTKIDAEIDARNFLGVGLTKRQAHRERYG